MIIAKPRQNKKVRYSIYAGLAVIVLVGAMFVLDLTNITHLFHKEKLPVITASQFTKGTPRGAAQNNSTSKSSTSTKANPGNTQNGSSPTTINVITPTGEFVSNHHPNLGGSPAPNTITSVCTTTAGASCKISFTNATTGTVKSLPSQTTDEGGTTYWGWKLQDIGLTAGAWHIETTASSGTQVKTATDPMDLVVAP